MVRGVAGGGGPVGPAGLASAWRHGRCRPALCDARCGEATVKTAQDVNHGHSLAELCLPEWPWGSLWPTLPFSLSVRGGDTPAPQRCRLAERSEPRLQGPPASLWLCPPLLGQCPRAQGRWVCPADLLTCL